jgi:hypothetical protein
MEAAICCAESRLYTWELHNKNAALLTKRGV